MPLECAEEPGGLRRAAKMNLIGTCMKQVALIEPDKMLQACKGIFASLNLETAELQQLHSAIEWIQLNAVASMSADEVKQIIRHRSRNEGTDIATCLLYAYWLCLPNTRRLVEIYAQAQLAESASPATHCPLRPDIVTVVPGALYQEYPTTGADGQPLIDLFTQLGIATERVPLKSAGRLHENRDILVDFFRSRQQSGGLLVSLSKGSSDIKFALRDFPDLLDSISVWINMAGTLSGTPLIEWVQDRPMVDWLNRLSFFLRRRDYQFFTDLDRREGGLLDFPLTLPNHLRVIHIAAVPLKRHARTRYARFSRHCFSKWGPNDGALMLEDLVGIPGEILPIWGVDHYCGPRWDFPALANVILRCWEEHTVPERAKAIFA